MMHDAGLHQPVRKPLGFAVRLSSILVGADAGVLEHAPAGERVQVVWSAVSVLLVFIFTAGAWTIGLSVARGWGFENLTVACLIGAVVMLLDRAMIPQHWGAQGLRLARERGIVTFGVGKSGGRIFRALSVGLRIAGAGVLSFVCASFMDLALYDRDIQSSIAAQNRADNAPLVRAAETRIDGEIVRIETEVAALASERDAILRRVNMANDRTVQAVDIKFEAAVSERAALIAKRDALTADLEAAKQDAHAEEFGGARSDGTLVRVAARGPKYAEARARYEDVVANLTTITNQIADLDARIDGATNTMPASAADPAAAAQIATLDAKYAALTRELAHLKRARTEAVAEAVKMDPAYVALPQGLIASAAALENLAAQSAWLRTRIFAVMAALALLDLAALGILLLTPAPPTYAVRLVCRQESEMAHLVSEACTEAAKHAEDRAKAIFTIEEVELNQMRERRRRMRAKMVDDMIAESFTEKQQENTEAFA